MFLTRFWKSLGGFASRLRDQRGARRHALARDFQPEVGLRRFGPGGMVRDFPGSLRDVSTTGAGVRLAATAWAARGDRAVLVIPLDDRKLEIPGTVAHFTVFPDYAVAGLFFQFSEIQPQREYLELFAAVASGATLGAIDATRQPRPEAERSMERYRADGGTRLNVWRHGTTRTPDQFELAMGDHLYRGSTDGSALQILHGNGAAMPVGGSGRAHLLFCWMVQNLAATVPGDVRDLLRKFAQPQPETGKGSALSAGNS
jgi:hypothetical protein